MDFPGSLCLQNSIRIGVPLDLLHEITTGDTLLGHWGAFVDSNLVKLKHLQLEFEKIGYIFLLHYLAFKPTVVRYLLVVLRLVPCLCVWTTSQ